MTVDPRTPVIIGIGQATGRRDALPGPEPLTQWETVCRLAIEDATLPSATAKAVEALYVTDCMSWRYDDPVARLAERLGIGEVWVKNDAANPTHSFKDRVVSVALEKQQVSVLAERVDSLLDEVVRR